MNTKKMFFENRLYDEGSSSSEEEEIVRSPTQVYCERSPLMKSLSRTLKEAEKIIVENGRRRSENHRETQYVGALVATIGGFIMGTALGWTAPAGPLLIANPNEYMFPVTKENVSWIAAYMPLGALIGCAVMAVLGSKLGRKNLMILLNLPIIAGWGLIIWAQSVTWIYCGRVLTGFASGSYSVIIPLYVSEIAEKEIRGTLGTYFQFQINAGILYIYIMGSYFNVYGLTISCTIIPLVYIVCLICLIPESPIFYLKKGIIDKAQLSLKYFRSPYNDLNQELNDMQKYLDKTERDRIPLIKAFQTIQAKRGLFLGLGVMVFQQFTGANAIIFYDTTIFNVTGSTIKSNTSTIIIGIIAVVSTYISTLVVDCLGRRILLLVSAIAMGISTLIIGGYFYAKDINYDVSFFSFVPLVSLCFFIILFNIGFGPIPWMLIGEIFPAQIKSIASSIVCMFNWLFVFLVIKYFSTLVTAIHIYNTFWLFTFFSVLGTFFVLYVVPETKGKTMEEIQELLGAGTPSQGIEESQNETNE